MSKKQVEQGGIDIKTMSLRKTFLGIRWSSYVYPVVRKKQGPDTVYVISQTTMGNTGFVKNATNDIIPSVLGLIVQTFRALVSGSAFACGSKGPWFESHTDITWISLDTKHETQSLHSTMVWKGSVYSGLIFLGAVCWLRETVTPGRPNASFLM